LLEQRAEDVPKRSVPDGVLFLTATVDVQAGRNRRFVVQVTGYGSMGERWLVDRYNIRQSLRCDGNGKAYRSIRQLPGRLGSFAHRCVRKIVATGI
jgi:phage terminase large subunit GpA-like protein